MSPTRQDEDPEPKDCSPGKSCSLKCPEVLNISTLNLTRTVWHKVTISYSLLSSPQLYSPLLFFPLLISTPLSSSFLSSPHLSPPLLSSAIPIGSFLACFCINVSDPCVLITTRTIYNSLEVFTGLSNAECSWMQGLNPTPSGQPTTGGLLWRLFHEGDRGRWGCLHLPPVISVSWATV